MRDACMHPDWQVSQDTVSSHRKAQLRADRFARRSNDSAARAIFKLCVVSLVAVQLGGCSLSRTAALESEPALVTSSITKPVAAEGIDSTDAEVIKSMVADADNASAPTAALAWSNPDTGNRGTIMAIDKFVGSHGQKCKKFQTTVDSFMGISLYNGETCELRTGFWVLSWFLREDK